MKSGKNTIRKCELFCNDQIIICLCNSCIFVSAFIITR